MILIGASQRVEWIEGRNERMDALDQRWSPLFWNSNIGLVPLPNHPESAIHIFETLSLKGLLLTGGNSLKNLGGDAPERDETERSLLAFAIQRKVPVLGICRGMQLIQDFFGVPLYPVEGHIAQRLRVKIKGEDVVVNSYHNYGTRETMPLLEVWARSDDGLVKAVSHKTLPIKGIMWHPEREDSFVKHDVSLIRELFILDCVVDSIK